MPNANIFTRFGLFVQRGFLDAESCQRIRCEMLLATRERAMVRPRGQDVVVVDETMRRTGLAAVPTATVTLVENRLLALKPALETYFQVGLTGCEQPGFLIYEEGDFFTPHQDAATDPPAPDYMKARRVSISILLNDEAGGLDGQSYQGGALVFYGRKGDHGATIGIPLDGEEGMCIAFRSDWLHEVQPIIRGRRYSIVTWFF